VLSIVILARNCRQLLTVCLQSVLDTAVSLGLEGPGVEYVLVDDFSDEESGVTKLFAEFRAAVASPVSILRFREHVHYSAGVAHGLSLAQKGHVLFLSHDMVITADCVRTLLLLASLHPEYGVIRPTSGHMDGASDFACRPPWPVRDVRDVVEFSAYVGEYQGTRATATEYLIGDAMLVTRQALDRAGTFDTRFRGFLADIDFGLRVQRSGLQVVTAHGAWLHHEGSGFTKDAVQRKGVTAEAVNRRNLADVVAAYEKFRDKWDPTLPLAYPGLDELPFDRLRALPHALHAGPQTAPELNSSVHDLVEETSAQRSDGL
jgi:GT2 family glycosyltransferase